MKTVILLFLLAGASFGQVEILKQKKEFEAARVAALEKIDEKHFQALLELKRKYEASGEDYLAEMALKEAKFFAEDRFDALLKGTKWRNEANRESVIEFVSGTSIRTGNPKVWYEGECEIKSLNTLTFKSEVNSWELRINFVRGTMDFTSFAPDGKKNHTYKMVRDE